MPRASRSGRRFQARVNFASGMGELWDWVIALPDENRKQEVIFHLHLGIKIAAGLAPAGQAGGRHVPPPDAADTSHAPRNRRMPRASRAGQSCVVRLDFTDAMGDLWDWVTALRAGGRVQEIFFHVHLGIKAARNLNGAGATLIGAGQVTPPPAVLALPTAQAVLATPTAQAVVVEPEAQPASPGQSLVLDDDWDLSGFLGAELD